LPELAFAGALAGRRFRYFEKDGFIISADADFTITGTIETDLLPEGPFGDHLGYYSLQHLFPVLKIEQVYHRPDAIFPFTVVGRPPQEDTSFGQLVHLISGPAIPAEISGLEAVHAVDAAGVHPLLLASAHERYVPYTERQPLEILTIANAILGFGQLSLAKYLFIAAAEDKPPEIHDIAGFLQHIFSRMDFTRDLHFQTQTTMDTLDYSHFTLNRGSKVIAAAAGKQQRRLSEIWPEQWTLPEGFSRPTLVFPGVFTVNGPSALKRKNYEQDAEHLAAHLSDLTETDGIALLVIVDEAGFCAERFNNFIWVTFTRSDPAADSYGLDAHFVDKHWTIRPPWIIDARLKDHHAPALECDPQVAEKVSEKLTQWR
jgi:4-hydroxy-3-polyprenylbenzoate decarboxylase